MPPTMEPDEANPPTTAADCEDGPTVDNAAPADREPTAVKAREEEGIAEATEKQKQGEEVIQSSGAQTIAAGGDVPMEPASDVKREESNGPASTPGKDTEAKNPSSQATSIEATKEEPAKMYGTGTHRVHYAC